MVMVHCLWRWDEHRGGRDIHCDACGKQTFHPKNSDLIAPSVQQISVHVETEAVLQFSSYPHSVSSRVKPCQALSNVGMYLPQPIFSHGKLCVARSKVGDSNALKAQSADCTKSIMEEKKIFIANVVYAYKL